MDHPAFPARTNVAAQLGLPCYCRSTGPRRLQVFFSDGERLEETTEGYSKERQGFFMVPEDPSGKILRVYVVNANVKEVKWLPAPQLPALQ